MSKSANVKILKNPPISGSVRERQFDCVANCTWVMFDDPSGDDWVGVFGNGPFRVSSFVVPFDDTIALVVAGGQGYVIDRTTEQLVRRTSWDDALTGISVPDSDIVIVADETEIWALSPTAELWRSSRVALDGVRLDEATRQRVRGKVWFFEGWYSFILDLERWQFERGELVAKDYFAFGLS